MRLGKILALSWLSSVVLVAACAGPSFEPHPRFAYKIYVENASIPRVIEQIDEFAEHADVSVNSRFPKEDYEMFAISIVGRDSSIVVFNPSRSEEIRLTAYLSLRSQDGAELAMETKVREIIARIQRVAPEAIVEGGAVKPPVLRRNQGNVGVVEPT